MLRTGYLINLTLLVRLSLFFLFLFSFVYKSEGYSILTHEAIIDAAWGESIEPYLKEQYGDSVSEEELREARAYAYGGAIMPDLGYFPLSNRFFTDLVHYVNSGDFVSTLIDEAQDIRELAFALGALSHYISDTYGHPGGINSTVALIYPHLKEKYGDTITYEDHPVSHRQVEFSFDVLQVARGNYATADYHRFIGFEVARDLLKRSFKKTYGLELQEVFPDLSFTISIFRFSVTTAFPGLTRAAWRLKKDEIDQKNEDTSMSELYRFDRKEYETRFGKGYREPGIKAILVSTLIRFFPKIGPLKVFKFKMPVDEAEKKFQQSFKVSLAEYKRAVSKVQSKGTLHLRNTNFDTGNSASGSKYELAVKTRKKLNRKLEKKRKSSR